MRKKLDLIMNSILLQTIKNGFTSISSLTIVASVFVLLTNFPIQSVNNFMIDNFSLLWLDILPSISASFYSLISVYIVISISYHYSKELCLPALITSVSTLYVYLVFIPFSSINNGEYISTYYLNSNGIFFSMIIGLIVPRIIKIVYKRNLTIKLPKEVPKEVSESFESIIPLLLVLTGATIINILIKSTSYNNIPNLIMKILQEPITYLGGTLIAVVIINFGVSFFWFFGFNGSFLFKSITTPVFTTLSIENINALSAGKDAPNIITATFQSVFINYGGSGSTLALIVAILITCKNIKLKQLAKLSFIPGLFNINEPIVYGIPIILNPILFFPLVICPVINTILAYFSMYFKIVSYTNGIQLPWTTPPFISGFLSSGISGLFLQVCLLVLNVLIYLPFVKKLDNSSKQFF
ncbi:PTS transporter subunit EIIC [Paenibacillus sp. HJL G12]|uniref:Permease IIC component n=1 Tax=Paenibacillus dendrobii TaxID=2691084 RepID=A0A7X3INE5_9BACL|nr:PTS transporter subunit EIIC [Paenibacillus dendrobii]MWV47157.1 PTS transporter subunit EIIC [Paenibacillus dendrobii]